DERDRHAPVPNAMDEVQRAVDRIDDPRALADRTAAFLAEHRVARERFGEPRAAERFDRPVGNAHPVLRIAFRLRRIGELAIEIAKRERARFARQRRSEFEARVERRGHWRVDSWWRGGNGAPQGGTYRHPVLLPMRHAPSIR